MTTAKCLQCNTNITPEDAVYDDHKSHYYCDITCFYRWTYENEHVVTEFYVKLNITE